MKFVIVFLTSLPLVGLGQDWMLINPDKQYHYSGDNSGDITHTILADSMDVDGELSTFYLNRVSVNCDTCDVFESGIVNCNDCLWHRDRGQFLGTHCIRESEDIWDFFLENGTLTIHPYTNLGESWLSDVGSIATVTSLTEEEVLGELDSLKLITFSDGGSVQISKDNGIIGWTLGNASYVLVGSSDTEFGQKLPSFEEIFDLEAGSVFQFKREVMYEEYPSPNNSGSYYESWGSSKLTLESIIALQGGFECTYTSMTLQTATDFPWQGDIWTEAWTDEETVYYMKADFDLDNAYPNKVIHRDGTLEVLPTFYKVFDFDGPLNYLTTDDGRRGWHLFDVDFLGFQGNGLIFQDFGDNYSVNDTLYNHFDIGGTFFQVEVPGLYSEHKAESFACVEGLGLTEYSWYSSWSAEEGMGAVRDCSWSLEGYVIDGDTTGTVYSDSYFTGIEELEIPHFDVSPNPVSSEMTVRFSQPFSGRLDLFGIDGVRIQTSNYIGLKSEILFTSSLSPGCYLLYATSIKGESSVRRLIKL